MKFPSKFVTYKNSIISKFPLFLSFLDDCDHSISELYNHVKSKIDGYHEFIDILDCLFMLGKIEFDESKEVIHYVKEN